MYKAATPITPSDANTIPQTNALYIGGAGNVRVTMAKGNTLTFIGVLAGTIYPLQVTQVHSTGTTATNIVGL